MNGGELDRKAKARQFVRSLQAELVMLMGEEHRAEIERLDVTQLIRLKAKTMDQLMAAPGPS